MTELAALALSLFGLRLNDAQLKLLATYERELIEWNQRMNLTAIATPEQIRVKHFLDSLSCAGVMQEPIDRVIDVGTGAGFPGLVLKIIYPNMRLTLVESVGKKANFCRHIANLLGLEGVVVVNERAETVGQMAAHRERYDWAVARAVAFLPTLAEFLLPLVKVGGAMIAMKGESGPAEAHAAGNAFQLLGGHLRKLYPVTLPGVADERFLAVVDKIAATPSQYPRRVGIPAKKPL
ncbi:MAG TPA: 16S rRNA (guanine(527)-N(7))-methyltransferase RsmG [Anaerolineales bacterium]|nr:16S rRNA (guanine(527)-N(7))-methyltransferase RsmG [Anaerolineales bacterium]